MFGIEQLRKSTDASFTQLETDIEGRRSESSLPLKTLPEYVEHQDGVSRAGALSAEALMRDYDRSSTAPITKPLSIRGDPRRLSGVALHLR
jgi:hypothetical protein